MTYEPSEYVKSLSPEEVVRALHYQYCSGAVWSERNPMITTPTMADAIEKTLAEDHAKGLCWNKP